MSELIELDISESEQESYIRSYIKSNMSQESYEQYVQVLNTTDSSSEASKAAILNEYINIAIKYSIDNQIKDI